MRVVPHEAVSCQAKGDHIHQEQISLVPQRLLLVRQEHGLLYIPVQQVGNQHIALGTRNEHHKCVSVGLVMIRRGPKRQAEEGQILHDVQEAGQDAQQSSAPADVFPIVLQVDFGNCQTEW